MSRIHKRNRGRGRTRRRVRVGAPDPSLTGNAGMAAISELCDRLDVVATLNRRVGPIKARERGHGAGQLLVGLAAAQLAGRPHVAIWAETETALAADLGCGLDDPRATASELMGRALAGLPSRIDRARVRLRVDAGRGSFQRLASGFVQSSRNHLQIVRKQVGIGVQGEPPHRRPISPVTPDRLDPDITRDYQLARAATAA